MKSKAHDLKSYSFSAEEQILVDANIWLYLFPAPRNSTNYLASQYSSAFKNLLSAKAQPILDPIVLSEYLNRYCRIEWGGEHKSQYAKFKYFRNSSYFSAVATSAQTFAQKIIDSCKVHSIPANELELNQALRDFSTGQIDFNDALLVDICKKRNFKLMTHDGDFQNSGIEILTTNPRLLRSCL